MSAETMDFSVSLSALERLKLILTKKPEGSFLRIAIQGGGCSGYQYTFSFEQALEEEDHVLEAQGIKIVIDSLSLGLLAGSELDYVQEMIGARFQIHNPQAKSSCGCGASFSVRKT